MTQPRRYQARHLRDAEKLTEREIAERLGVSQKTINRDLAETVPPAGFTQNGAPFYPPGRFDKDPEYREAVAEAARRMPLGNARRHIARKFSGAADRSRSLAWSSVRPSGYVSANGLHRGHPSLSGQTQVEARIP